MRHTRTLLATAAAVSLAACSGQGPEAENGASAGNETIGMNTSQAATDDDAQDARTLVDEAARQVETMKADPDLAGLMQKAKGIYIVPEFGRGALIVGGRGGAGVVVANQDTGWSPPAFYDFGSLSVGAQAGGSGGQLAFLLMTDDAVNAFMSGNQVSLNAESGLSIINYSENAQASLGKGDIIMWSDTEGAYAGATVSVTDINWDDENNRAYYGRDVEPRQVLTGKVSAPQSSNLESALPS
ncbi:lipid-binding SYLF domain-containing protein [Stakelama saccharophila]|uniref:Lipid-binding SYLF domain-containing protein n=1 Tax=Stakelama saccharophila TaxID=3075605 RepID=A0ABZ0BB46_9SPHN|nr:lipid-binding SYLF domain-containing protein [Stakelama sp. W311]WNO54495.1 lipid-binding SYLF domain-containing protein [Stakelama sp. W311]